jgi:hypothetical protein
MNLSQWPAKVGEGGTQMGPGVELVQALYYDDLQRAV